MIFPSVSISNIAVVFILLLPFVYFPFSNAYELPKFIFFTVFALGLFLVSALQAVRLEKSIIPITDKLSVLFCAFLVVTFIADIAGIDPGTSLRGGVVRYQGFILLFASFCLVIAIRLQSVVNRQQSFLFFQKMLMLTLFGICLFVFWQAVSLVFFHNYDIHLYQGRFVGTFGNPDFLGGYLAMCLPFVLFKFVENRHSGKSDGKSDASRIDSGVALLPRMTIVRSILIGMILLVIVLTDSRAAFLAVGVIFCVVIARSLHDLPAGRQAWQSSIFCLIIASMFIFLITSHLNDIYHLSEKFLFARSSMWDNRILIWQGAVEAFLRRPILGFGQENFELAFTKVRFYPVDNAHNIFLETAISSGIIGLCIFVLLLREAFVLAPFVVKLSLIAFLIVAFFNPLSIAQIAFFWFLLGINNRSGG